MGRDLCEHRPGGSSLGVPDLPLPQAFCVQMSDSVSLFADALRRHNRKHSAWRDGHCDAQGEPHLANTWSCVRRGSTCPTLPTLVPTFVGVLNHFPSDSGRFCNTLLSNVEPDPPLELHCEAHQWSLRFHLPAQNSPSSMCSLPLATRSTLNTNGQIGHFLVKHLHRNLFSQVIASSPLPLHSGPYIPCQSTLSRP